MVKADTDTFDMKHFFDEFFALEVEDLHTVNSMVVEMIKRKSNAAAAKNIQSLSKGDIVKISDKDAARINFQLINTKFIINKVARTTVSISFLNEDGTINTKRPGYKINAKCIEKI